MSATCIIAPHQWRQQSDYVPKFAPSKSSSWSCCQRDIIFCQNDERNKPGFREGERCGKRNLLLGLTSLGLNTQWITTSDVAAAETQANDAIIPSLPAGSEVTLSILQKCGLGVSIYPDFVYNPVGGGGPGLAEDSNESKIFVRFDPKQLNVPAVEFSTTTILGVPIPPPLKIEIVPKVLEGFIDRSTGQVDLHFLANFNFTAGPFYKARPLIVDTVLTTEESKGVFRGGQGSRLNSAGNCLLVGAARLSTVNDPFLDNFLILPTDVLAVLPAKFSFTQYVSTVESHL